MKKYIVLALTVLMVLGLIGGVAGASIYDKWVGELGRTPRAPGETEDASGYVEINYVKGQKEYNFNLYTEGLLVGVEYEIFLRADTGGGSFTDTIVGTFTPYYDEEIEKVIGVYSENHRTSGRLEIGSFLSMDNPRVIVTKVDAWGDYILNTVRGEDLEPVGSNRGE